MRSGIEKMKQMRFAVLAFCAGVLIQVAGADETMRGDWKLGSIRDGVVRIELHSGEGARMRQASEDFEISSLKGIDAGQLRVADGKVRFTIEREPGSFRMDGMLREGQGGGTFLFAPNPAFLRHLHEAGVDAGDEAILFDLAMNGFTLDDARKLRQAGLGSLSAADLLQLKEHGVTPDWLAKVTAARSGFLSRDIIRLRDHGVDGNYIRGLSDVGLSNLRAEDIVRLHDNGIEIKYIERMRTAGFTNLTVDQIIRLRQQGVD